MNKRRPGDRRDRKPRASGSRPVPPPAAKTPRPVRPRPVLSERPDEETQETFRIVERIEPKSPGAFRVLIAVHRPRFRGRAERAADLVGWEVTALKNKQDPVGQVARPPRPPDLLILSGDFGRQRDYAIFRAVQRWRAQGMKLIGLVEDCQTAPEGRPDSIPAQLCDFCLEPPYRTADFRALFAQCYEQNRGKPAPPPRSAVDAEEEGDDEE